MKFSINGEEFTIVNVKQQSAPTNYAVFKYEEHKPISQLQFTAFGDIDLQRKLKNFFLEKVFKPYVRR